MPEQTEPLFRAWFGRFNETQEPQLDVLHPDVEWHLRADLPDSRTLRGHEDVRRLNADWTEAFEDLRLEATQISDVAGKTVVDVHFHAHIRGSLQEVDMDEVWLVTWRDDMIVEIREFRTSGEALRSLGLAA
jgi:ketosteroid isomerase-like protein